MPFAEPPGWTQERGRRLKQQYPQLQYTTVDTLLAVDNYSSSRGSPPSALSQRAMDTAVTAADQTARFREVDRSVPIPESRRVSYRGRSGRPGDGADRSDGGLLGDVGTFVGETLQRMPSDILRSVGTVAGQLDRPRGAFFGSVAEQEQQPVWRAPFAAVQGAVSGFRDPQAYQGRDSSLGRRFSDVDTIGPLSPRDIAGGVLDVVFDPVDLATGGLVATDVARGVKKGAKAATRGVRAGVRAIDDDLARQAIRQAEGPLETSTRGALPDVGQVVPGVTQPRGVGRGGAVAPPATAKEFESPPTLQRLFGTDVIEEGKQRGLSQRIGEELQIRADEPVSRPGLRVRDEARRAVTNQSTVATAKARNVVRDSGFEFDESGRIGRLAGIDPSVPGAPTLRDVAARLPLYEPYLTPRQIEAMGELRDIVSPFSQALDEVISVQEQIIGKKSPIRIGSRADVMEGGFYIPRGTAETEELADLATRRLGGGAGRRGKEGFEKSATFASEAEGIEAGYGYTDVADAIGGYVRGAGNRALDQHTANYFLTRTDAAGRRLAQTPKDRLLRSNPQLADEMQALREDVASLRGAGVRLSERQERVIEEFFTNPEFDDIDELYDAINSISVGAYRGGEGRNFGKTIPQIRADLDAAKARMAEIRPEYRLAMRQAASTPRDQSRIALRGLDQYSFPWEIADEANRILRREVADEGNVTSSLRAVNSIMRGVQATGEMSYLGIQMAIGMLTDPVGYARAAKAATKAWGNQGDQVLGQFLRQADARDIAKGLPDSEWWAARGLRMAESGTEFRIGGRQLPGAAQKVADAPGIKQALSVPKSIVKRADRGFGVAGDTMRRELASTLAEERMLRGLPLDDAWGKITAESVNRASGWTPQRAFGDWGEAANFAPRYLAARVRALGQLASADPLKRQQARRLIGRYIAIASTLTVLANAAQGQDTDFRPFSGSKGPTFNPFDAEYKNPNFMRVRNTLNRDWSLLGPVDATLGILIGAGSLVTNPTGDPSTALDRMSSVFTGPIALLGMDWLVNKETFEGEPLDNPEALGRDLIQRLVPFAGPELIEGAISTGESVRQGDVGGAVSEGAGTVLQAGAGFRGTPLSRGERVQLGEYRKMNPEDQWKSISALSWQTLGSNPSWEKIASKYGNAFQYAQALKGKIISDALAEGKTRGQAETEAESVLRKNRFYKEYLDIRESLRTQWVKKNPALAVELWDKESVKPWDERDWTPTKEQREFMDAYLSGRRTEAGVR